MGELEHAVSGHYAIDDLADRILDALRSAGADVDALTVDDLAPVDAFHVRGRGATEELCRLAGLSADDRVLDVGSGLGGTCRYLAHAVGCRVAGVDLTEAFCRAAETLSARVGMAERTAFHHGSALDLPFEDGAFDVAWTEHAQMNVPDKARFFGEMARVVRPGGRVVFHDFVAGDGAAVRYPVPWASEAPLSHLADPDALRALLADALDLYEIHWHDRSAESIDYLETGLARVAAEGPPPLGLHLLTGADTKAKFENVLWNLREGRVRVIQGVFARS